MSGSKKLSPEEGGEGEGDGDEPVYGDPAHHDRWRLLVETQRDMADVRRFDPVARARRYSDSPLAAGVLVLCDELDATPAALRDWGCGLE